MDESVLSEEDNSDESDSMIKNQRERELEGINLEERKKSEKRLRESGESSEEGFISVTRRRPKRLIRSDSPDNNNSNMEQHLNEERNGHGIVQYEVIDGGVTRQVARAMEVLHASAPGARVRVMRAAYHSSAGPGAPASSYLMHSSRQVISSGYNFLEPSSLPSKPLEISSTPLESSPDSEIEKENYKVTEPDDYDISEPSKWRASSRKNSIRMPSEESSSADNASIIDLDSRASSRNTLRRSFRKKEDVQRVHNINTRVSPLLDAPVTLSTLKYTSLLNGSDEWNNRRKSYSFEDTSINQNISNKNDSLTMDSSTDSGICKSSEIVNDQFNSKKYTNFSEKTDYNQEESFTEWLSRNRLKTYKDMTPPKRTNTPDLQKNRDKIILKSSGKVTITLPTENSKDTPTRTSKPDDCDRRTKKVEFCKTELHFAVDTGTVNIIATDEKPPPSNDFRRKRSAFVPLNEKIEKSITLFGEKSELSENDIQENNILSSDFGDVDENTAATKSILKNKILKPKPYLLGENMAFGNFSDSTNDFVLSKNLTTSSAVSLINRQLSKRRNSNETISSSASDTSNTFDNSLRTGTKGPQLRGNSNHRNTTTVISDFNTQLKDNSFDQKKSPRPELSPTENKPKIRELRGSELAYFGIDHNNKPKNVHRQDNLQEEIFHSVKLVQQISNSVCNSEADSDEAPEYQNILSKYTVTPTPKPRSIYGDEVRKGNAPRILKPIIEQDFEKIGSSDVARSISKKNNEISKPLNVDNTPSTKITKERMSKQKSVKNNITNDYPTTEKNKTTFLKKVKDNKENQSFKSRNIKTDKSKQEAPLYINLQSRSERIVQSSGNKNYKSGDERSPVTTNDSKISKSCVNPVKSTPKFDKNGISDEVIEKSRVNSRDKKDEFLHENSQKLKKQIPRRTEKLTTPDHLQEKCNRQRFNDKNSIGNRHDKYETYNTNSLKKKQSKDAAKIVEYNISKSNKIDDLKNNLSENNVNNHNTTKSVNRSVESKDSSNENKTSVKSHEGNKNYQHVIKLSTTKTVENSTPNTKPQKSSKSKRNKYVINYDDKNGTVSSICKIKSVPGTYTRKLISVENKTPQECTNNNRLNKIALKK